MPNLKKILLLETLILIGLILAGTFYYFNQKGKEERILPAQIASQKAIDFINQFLLQGGKASLIDLGEESGLYKLRLKIQDQEYTSYLTKDGKILFPNEGINLEIEMAKKTEIPKRDKPDVKIFVMSYCPFGLQIQKAFLPVYDLLQKKAEMGIYFVNYIMHEKKEIDENLRQYCIQKEEKEKYSNYLNCFIKDGNFEKCLLEANIDKTKLNSCISQTDQTYKITQLYNDKSSWLNGRFPKFDLHTDLNEKYGVQGSPTVVINDTIVEVNPRSPEKLKEIICQAFTSPPSECSQKLSEKSFSPGFGLETGSSGGGQCR